MNKISKKLTSLITPGMYIKGKWHKNEYMIKQLLGSGAIGSVYLVKYNGREAALKISENSTSMTMEVNVLKSLAKVQGSHLGPSLLDVDDWVLSNGQTYTFYVMEYVRGVTLPTYMQQNGHEWIGVFMLQLLDDLEKLHQAGWIFGDLKVDNLLVTSSSPARIRWIDVGGTTQIGRAIKEYTEFYDRGYWGMGSRKAEPSYDLFAFVMVWINLFYPRQFEKGKHPKLTLMKKLQEIPALKSYRQCLQQALLGKYDTSQEMKRDLIHLLQRLQKGKRERVDRLPFLIEIIGLTVISSGYYFTSLLIP